MPGESPKAKAREWNCCVISLRWQAGAGVAPGRAGYENRKFYRSDYVHPYLGCKQRCPSDRNARAAIPTGWSSHPVCSPDYSPKTLFFYRPAAGRFPRVRLKLR